MKWLEIIEPRTVDIYRELLELQLAKLIDEVDKERKMQATKS